jgi:hypothetical protein
MVGDGHAVGVTAEIVQHILGAAKGWFRVYDPVFSEQWPEPGSEDLGLIEERIVARLATGRDAAGGLGCLHMLGT